MRLPSDLISITRGQLTALIDITPRPYTGPTNTPKQRANKLQHERLEEEYLSHSLKTVDKINEWMDHPDTDAVLVLEVKAMDSSNLGRVQFLRLGPKCEHQLDKVDHKSCIGDVPSRMYYASYYCATPWFIERYMFAGTEVMPFSYGPFTITPVPDASVFETHQRANTLPSGDTPFKLPAAISDLPAILLHLDGARCSEQPFSDLR